MSVATTSLSATDGDPLRSGTIPQHLLPRGLLALEGGGESILGGDQVRPALKLPFIL